MAVVDDEIGGSRALRMNEEEFMTLESHRFKFCLLSSVGVVAWVSELRLSREETR